MVTANDKYSEKANIKIEWKHPQGRRNNLYGQEKRLIRKYDITEYRYI